MSVKGDDGYTQLSFSPCSVNLFADYLLIDVFLFLCHLVLCLFFFAKRLLLLSNVKNFIKVQKVQTNGHLATFFRFHKVLVTKNAPSGAFIFLFFLIGKKDVYSKNC